MGALFLYLHENRIKILDCWLNNIGWIKIGFNLAAHTDFPISPFNRLDDKLFDFTRDEGYGADQNVIECKNCDLTENKMGILFQNVVQWGRAIVRCQNTEKRSRQRWINLQLKKQALFV